MGGTNWLRDDGTVNGECHFYKVDTRSPVYYARFKTLTCGGRGRWAPMSTDPIHQD